MTKAEFKNHLDAAEKSPKEIAAAVSGLPEKVLRYKPSLEKWCVLEITSKTRADCRSFASLRVRVHDELENSMRACNLSSAAPVSMAFAAVATASRT